MATFLTTKWFRDPSAFLPGETSHGHYQIELRCQACHTPWKGVKENACYDCHADELKLANDSHPKSKFTDPRNADRLAAIDASNCVTCHKEHLPERTRAMGVTIPNDFCYHCHQQTLQDRPSHKNFAFNSCSAAGCHNYHDNTALYEDFLSRHLHEADFKEPARVPARSLAAWMSQTGALKPQAARDLSANEAPPFVKSTPEILHEWESTAHARAGINCADCHLVQDSDAKTRRWSDKLDHNSCASCHTEEASGFLAGKHGMRLAQGLSPMRPAMARLPMKREAMHKELTCVSCHASHDFDTRQAAVDSCLGCHDDTHSRAYKQSSHFQLWRDELAGNALPGTGVSCATCHLPREERTLDGVTRQVVQHNQNANLRPNEKMVRKVCLACHGLSFTLDALADATMIHSNFHGRPTIALETLKLVEERTRELIKKEKP